MTSSPAHNLVQQATRLADDEIDLRQFAAALERQKKLIAAITGAVLILSGLFAFTRKPVWEGQFQIVLENQDSGSAGRLAQLSANNPLLANLAGIGGSGGSQLQTEVKVLESPSVLKPTYDFVKASKSRNGADVSNWTFIGWRKNLEIELEKGTSVLNISYRDTDPELILPVIKKISLDYQNYSGRDRKRGLAQGVQYLQRQVYERTELSKKSMRRSQAYALANGLGLQDGSPGASTSSTASASVEASREAAQNRVNALEQQLASARHADNHIVFQAPQLVANAELYGQLQILEAELLQKKSLLKPNDDFIRRLTRRRQNLIKYINQQTVGLLEGELVTAKSQLTSLSRPREVVLQHRELVRTALQDEKLLAELETQLQTLELEQARQTDPWELISTPTLLDTPVSPRKKRILALGLLGGLFLGCCAGLIRDRLSGLVFSDDELKYLLPCDLLERLPANSPQHWSSSCTMLAQNLLKEAQSVALIPIGNIPKQALKHLEQELNSALGSRQLLITCDLLTSQSRSIQLLVTAPGAAKRQDLYRLRDRLALQGTPLAGWLLIDPEREA